jgi:hypothetical protein
MYAEENSVTPVDTEDPDIAFGLCDLSMVHLIFGPAVH